MKKFTLLSIITIFLSIVSLQAQNAWINELHYDNASTDVGEFVEVVIESPGTYAPADFTITFYNGGNSLSYGSITVDNATITNSYGDFSVYYVPYPGIQNGGPDGLSLDYLGTLITGQFLSYEGSFTALDGPANGILSSDMGVSETSTTPIGQSLQLSGTGSVYGDFTWVAPAAETPGVVNNGQILDIGGNLPPTISNVIQTPVTVTSSLTVSVSADVTDSDGTVDLVELNWGTTSGVLTNTINMSGSGTYTTDSPIPAQANGTTVYYQVYAEDNIGDDASSLEMSYTVFDPASTTLPYNEPFDLNLGNCYTFSTSGPLKYWHYASFGGNGYAEMNGYNSGDVEEDWLVFPAINFDNYSNERMSFDTWYQYGDADVNNYLKLFWSPDYYGVGDPSTFTWNEISYTTPGVPDTWTSSGTLDISGITGSNVYIALKYRDEPTDYRWWQVDNIAIYEAAYVNVTFQVNMEEQVVSPNGVHVAGTFNGWNAGATEMLDGDLDGTYDVTLSLISGLEYQFKYINGNAWGTNGVEQEVVPYACQASDSDNRYEIIGETDYSIDPVCYGSCNDCGYVLPSHDVTFQVNMQNETVGGVVNIAGDFTGWGDVAMTNVFGSIWQITLPLDEGTTQNYKFKNGGDWENFDGPCLTGSYGNRYVVVPAENITLDLVCYNSCDACPAVDFVMINEVDADTPGTDVEEFIELYDGGVGNTDLSGLVVVLYNGSDNQSYLPAIDLDGYFTNVDGYFVIGSTGMGTDIELSPGASGWLQNGADAVALFIGDDTDFPNDTPVTDVNLIDAIVYGTNDPDATALIDVLTPGQPQVNESGRGDPSLNSSQRIPNGSGGMRVTTTYDQSTPTTGVINVSVYTDWTGAVDSNWDDAGNWTNGVPTAGLNASIPDVGTKAPFPVISNPGAVTNQLYIASNAELNINVNGDLTTNGTFSNSGTFTIMNDGTANVGSFIDNGGITGGGTFNFYREMMGTSASGADHGWHFISPPTDGLTSDQLLPDYYLNWWNEGGDTWVHVEGGDCSNPAVFSFANGVGYSVLRDLAYTCPNPVGNNLNFGGPFYNMHNSGGTYAPTYTVDGTFEGGGWNLLGNPYPSPVDINTMVNDAGFPTSLNGAVYIYDDNSLDYLESAGGVGEVSQVPATQGFFMQATGSGTLTFNNAWRTHAGSDNFYKNEIADVLELSVTGNGYSDNIFVRFLNEASTGFDGMYDAHKLISSVEFVPQIYTTNGINKFAINALPATAIVPMGFTCVTSGEYTISAIETSDFSNVVLEDRFTGEQTDLLSDSYTFNYTVNDDADRFFVHFTPLGTPELSASSINIWSSDHKIYVQTPEINGDIVVFNLMGQEVIRTQIESGLNVIPVSEANAFYVVKIVGSEASKTGKVYVR